MLPGGCRGGSWSWGCCHPPCAGQCDCWCFLTIAVAASSAGTLLAVLCLLSFSNKSADRFADWSKPGSMQRTCKADLGPLPVSPMGFVDQPSSKQVICCGQCFAVGFGFSFLICTGMKHA